MRVRYFLSEKLLLVHICLHDNYQMYFVIYKSATTINNRSRSPAVNTPFLHLVSKREKISKLWYIFVQRQFRCVHAAGKSVNIRKSREKTVAIKRSRALRCWKQTIAHLGREMTTFLWTESDDKKCIKKKN